MLPPHWMQLQVAISHPVVDAEFIPNEQIHTPSSHRTSQQGICCAAGPEALPYVPWMTSMLSHLSRKSKILGLFFGSDRFNSEPQPGTQRLLKGECRVLSSALCQAGPRLQLQTGLKAHLGWSQDIWTGTACTSPGRQK